MKNSKEVFAGITELEKKIINGSGLFFFKSELSGKKQLEILKWYRRIHQFERDYVDILIQEGKDDAEFFAQDN